MQQTRLIALDVFRGMTLVLMLIVNNPGDWGQVYGPFLHADWHGCTLTDLVFPFFLFIVGVAIPLALGARKESGKTEIQLYRKIFIRVLIIFLLGIFLSGFPYFRLATIRIPGVLQRIAIVYGIVSILYLYFSIRSLLIIGAAILIVYWGMMTLMPVPGLGYASLEPETNLGAWLDYKLLKGHLWSQSKVWDPEGILSTLPAIGTGILGVWTGTLLKKSWSLHEKINQVFFIGVICLLIGYFWDMVFPINKKIWTSSYVVFVGGLSMMTLASLIYLIDIKGSKSWTKHFIYFGMNSLMVFVGSGIVARLMGIIKIPVGDISMSLKSWTYQGYQYQWLDPKVSSLLFALSFMLLFYFILKWMYKHHWFWKM